MYILKVVLGIVILVIVLVICFVAGVYSKIKNLDAAVFEAFAGLDIHMRKRADDIFKIIEFIEKKDISAEDRDFLEVVKNIAIDSKKESDADRRVKLEEEFQKSFEDILEIAERSGECFGDETFDNYVASFRKDKMKVQEAGSEYNKCVNIYNSIIFQKRTAGVANMFGYDRKNLYKLREEA